MKNLVSKTKNIKVGLCRRTQKKTCHKSLHFCTNEVGVISRQEASPVLNNNNTNMIQLWWWLLSLGEAGGAGPPSGPGPQSPLTSRTEMTDWDVSQSDDKSGSGRPQWVWPGPPGRGCGHSGPRRWDDQHSDDFVLKYRILEIHQFSNNFKLNGKGVTTFIFNIDWV